MGKRYNLSISRNYVSDWDAANAIREIDFPFKAHNTGVI